MHKVPNLLRLLADFQNQAYWRNYMKNCPKQGWVDKELGECATCKSCASMEVI